MCEDTWRRLDADFDRIIAGLEVVARPGATPAQDDLQDLAAFGRPPVAAIHKLPPAHTGNWREDCHGASAFSAARHSAEAELKGTAIIDLGREEEAEPMIAIALAGHRGGETSRASHDALGEGAVVLQFGKRGAEFPPRQFIRGGEQTVTAGQRDVPSITRRSASLALRR